MEDSGFFFFQSQRHNERAFNTTLMKILIFICFYMTKGSVGFLI